ncbi:MAG: thioredoxin family protein [Anaerolineales bacterium]|nr:thioredoxin family protein [Anaerolineales bacterium]
MKRKIYFVFLIISMFACNFLFPQTSSIEQVPTAEILVTNAPEIPTAITLITNAPEISTAEVLVLYDNFMVVRVHPTDGDLQTLLKIEAKHATALGLMPIVEFDATWCPPCLAIDKAIKEKNELMLNAYRGTYIIKFDVDDWGWNDGVLENFNFEFIPVYFKVNVNGEQTGETINGGAWGEDIPENIAPVMDSFFHNN